MLTTAQSSFCESQINDSTLSTDLESEFEFQVAVGLTKYCLPVIILAGLFGNTMVIIIQRRLKDSQNESMSIYFTTLAMSDSLLLLSNPVFTVLEANGVFLNAPLEALYRLRVWIIYTTSWTSPWLLVAMTIQQAVSVVWPHKVRLLVSGRQAGTYAFVLFLLCALSNAHILYGHTLGDQESGQIVGGVYQFASDNYREFFYTVWSWVDMSVSVLVPFALVVAANAVLIQIISWSMKDMRISFAAGNSRAFRSRETRASSMTVRLIGASVAFLLLTTPLCVCNVMLATLSSEEDNDVTQVAASQLTFTITMLLWYTNYAVNFYVYCLSGRKYRRECAQVLRCTSTTKRAKAFSDAEGH